VRSVGKFLGIRGILRTNTVADIKAGINETQYVGEYWLEKWCRTTRA
jgi:hypothetical protein